MVLMTTSHPQTAPVDDRTDVRDYRFERTNRADGAFGPEGRTAEAWAQRSRIVLTPIAAPSILGLYGFFAATLLVGSNLAHWWGGPTSATLVFPFAMMLGGLAQFVAGIWAYRARDGLATAMHGIWGTFWLAFGLYQWLAATHVLPAVSSPVDVGFGMWFVALGAITAMGALAALATSLGLFAVLGPLAAGSIFAAVGYIGGYGWTLTVAGWLFVFSAGFAWYLASAMMLEGAFGRTLLPTGQWKAAAMIPGRMATEPIQYERGMPGARAGQ
jgi:succinate-acetate transporter protein